MMQTVWNQNYSWKPFSEPLSKGRKQKAFHRILRALKGPVQPLLDLHKPRPSVGIEPSLLLLEMRSLALIFSEVPLSLIGLR